MREFLESIYTIIDMIGNFFSWFYDAIINVFNFISTGFSYFTGAIAQLPTLVVAPAAILLSLGILYLILGR